jgi:hypothetical protein
MIGVMPAAQEYRVLQRMASTKEALKVERLRSVDTLESCSGSIRDFYKRIDPRELSKHIKSRFQAWDSDHSGALDKAELTEAMAAMGRRPSAQEVDDLMLKVPLSPSAQHVPWRGRFFLHGLAHQCFRVEQKSGVAHRAWLRSPFPLRRSTRTAAGRSSWTSLSTWSARRWSPLARGVSPRHRCAPWLLAHYGSSLERAQGTARREPSVAQAVLGRGEMRPLQECAEPPLTARRGRA